MVIKETTGCCCSSTESEYCALAHTFADITWIQQVLGKLGISQSCTPIIWCDNIIASVLASNPIHHAQTKHIQINIHFVRDKVLDGQLEIRYVPSIDKIVDCLMISLFHTQFSQSSNQTCRSFTLLLVCGGMLRKKQRPTTTKSTIPYVPIHQDK